MTLVTLDTDSINPTAGQLPCKSFILIKQMQRRSSSLSEGNQQLVSPTIPLCYKRPTVPSCHGGFPGRNLFCSEIKLFKETSTQKALHPSTAMESVVVGHHSGESLDDVLCTVLTRRLDSRLQGNVPAHKEVDAFFRNAEEKVTETTLKCIVSVFNFSLGCIQYIYQSPTSYLPV